jgi:flagellar biosynthesis protein FlhG
MKPFWELDHYGVLEASRSASEPELERAYRLALSTYSDDSLAGYSLFGEGDVAALRDRIETAYRVLSDPEGRRVYDASLQVATPFAPESAETIVVTIDDPAPEPERARELSPPRVASPIPNPVFDEEEERGDQNGALLRRARLRRGLELQKIAEVTKVSPHNLQLIEDDRYDALPAPVYVRGFVQAYADSLGLDGRAFARGYLERCEAARRDSAKHRRFR